MSSDQLDRRKLEHIELASRSQTGASDLEAMSSFFNYEPMLSSHKTPEIEAFSFLGKSMSFPLWVSSMTGGTGKARHINQNLARACKEFGLGMGLGSCRPLLNSDKNFADFDLRSVIGEEAPFFANLGIAQLEELQDSGGENKVFNILEKLNADGLMIHVNPLQEWFQPEGDRFKRAPLETIKFYQDKLQNKYKIVVKEVGQGMGPKSLDALLNVGVDGIEFGAFGGTNFSRLEELRAGNHSDPLALIGHTADEMIAMLQNHKNSFSTEIIISGGIKNYLHGYYLMEKCPLHCVYGQAYGLLKYADADYEKLQSHIESQVRGFKMAKSFLSVR